MTLLRSHRRRVARALAWLAVSSSVAGAPSGFAQSMPGASEAQQRAAALMEEGVRLRQSDQTEEALHRFREAYALYPTVAARVRIGLAAAQLERWVESAEALSVALRATQDEFVAANSAALQRELTNAEAHLGVLLLDGGPDDARVRVNGVERGALGGLRRLYLTPGPVLLECAAPGFERFIMRTSIRERDVERRAISMPAVVVAPSAPAPTAEPVAPPPPVPAPTVAPLASRPVAPTLRPDSETALIAPPAPPARSAMRPLGGTFLGIGVVAAGAGVATHVLWQQAVGRFNMLGCYLRNDAVYGGGNCLADADTASAMRGISLAGYIGGGVLGLTGIILLAAAPGDGPADPRARAFACGPSADARGLWCAGAF